MMRPIAIVCSIVLSGVLQVRSARAEGDPFPPLSVPQQVQELEEKGQTAYRANELEQARGWWLQAFALQADPQIALNLGRVELSLKRYRDSAEHLDFALRQLPDSASERTRTDAKKGLGEARSHVAAVEVTTTRADVEVRVDDKVVGTAPLAHVLYLEPGTHEVSAHLGSNSIKRAVSVQSGQVYQVNLPLVVQTRSVDPRHAEPAPNADTKTERLQEKAPPAATSESHRNPVPLVVGGALFMAGVASGIVFRLNSDAHFDDAEQMRAQRATTGCVGEQSLSKECQALMSATESGDRARNLSTVSFAVAGVALAGTLTYWFWPKRREKPQQAALFDWHLAPNVSDKSSGLLFWGAY